MLNEYTVWFAGDPDMAGDYLGYDGPFPPPNDLRLHRYFFRLFALDIATLSVPARFTAAEVKQAMKGHVLAEAAIRSEEHTSELQALMSTSYAVFCLKKKKQHNTAEH